MRKSILVLALLVLGVTGFTQDAIPKDSWITKSILKVKKTKLLSIISIERSCFSGPGIGYSSRYEVAVGVFSDCLGWKLTVDELKGALASDTPLSAGSLALVEKVRSWKPAQPELLKLTHELKKEMEALGVPYSEFEPQVRGLAKDSDNLLQSLKGRAGSGFWDVPNGHWASAALIALRKMGLITGYPEGHFGCPCGS